VVYEYLYFFRGSLEPVRERRTCPGDGPARARAAEELLRIPSISALPEHRKDVARCAQWVADEMERIGLEHDALTSDLDTAFLAPARNEPVYCTARILKFGKRRIYGVAQCHDHNGGLFTHHTMTYVRVT